MSKAYTPFEEEFGVGDVVDYKGYRYIVREIYLDEDGYYYLISEANDTGYLNNMPFEAEVPQEDLTAL